jgi:hypothetical protein
MKGIVASLSDLGESVSDCMLILNLFHGLNERYDHICTWITRLVLFPSFHKVRNNLILEELTKGLPSCFDDAATLYSSTPRGQTS